VALAREVVSEDHITRSKTTRGAIADPDFHLPRENKMYCRRGAVCQWLRRLFESVLKRCIAEGLVGGEGFAVQAAC
jgi:hypothetical protein